MPLIPLALALAQQLTMDPRFQPASPLPTIPPVMVDSFATSVGLAQQIARNQSLQARVLWIDATANIERYDTEQKISELVANIKSVGFNTIVFDIKPISGHVVYPSKLAPKLLEWKGKTLPADFDPLAIFVREAKAQEITLFVSLNAFSEGHRIFKVGPGYNKVEQQTVLYESSPVLVANGQRFPLATKLNTPDPNAVGVFTSALPPPAPGSWLAVLSRRGDVLSTAEYAAPATIPAGATALYATGAAAAFLQANTAVGQRVQFDSDAVYVPIQERPEQQIPLMMNPNDPAERQYALDIVREVVTNYPVQGIVYDDRLRYAGMNADFSPQTRQKFEAVIGHPITWPDDVFRWTYTLNLTRGLRPGRYYDQWMAWRASVIRDYVRDVRKLVTGLRPATKFGSYVGSWYGEYAALGHNYASPNARAGFWFLSPNYQQSGTAPLLDFLITGAYYRTPTIYDAMVNGQNIGSTVEAAGTLVNRLVGDQTWTYAGLSLIDFAGDPDGLQNALQAACAATQGVMVFDLSHNIEPMWPAFAQAFSQKRQAPHERPLVLAEMRRRRRALDQAGYVEPPIIIAAGSAGTGQ